MAYYCCGASEPEASERSSSLIDEVNNLYLYLLFNSNRTADIAANIYKTFTNSFRLRLFRYFLL